MDLSLILEWVIKAIFLLLFGTAGFAYLTLYERRALARIQTRIGPNRAGPFGTGNEFGRQRDRQRIYQWPLLRRVWREISADLA